MTFHDFAALADTLAQTSAHKEKYRLMGDYLATLHDDDLLLAARYLAGTPFPLSDERVLNVGGAIIRDAITTITGIDQAHWNALVVQHGDFGDAAVHALADRVQQSTLSLRDVQNLFDTLVTARGAKQKLPQIIAVLEQATALEARYIIKLMSGELRIGVREGQVQIALQNAYDQPIQQIQRANMLLGDIGEVALLARAGQLANVTLQMFRPLKFMLASPITEPAEIRRSIQHEFFVEDKYDGIRAQAHVADGKLALYSRTLDEISQRFPELHDGLRSLAGSWILDGEIVAARDGVILPFATLQTRLGRKNVAADVLASAPVIYIIYDVLLHDGVSLLETPFAQRRAILEQLQLTAPIQLALSHREHEPTAIDQHFTAARERGNEGLMIKDPDSLYTPGRRGREWLKVKKALATLDVVVTAAEVGNGKRRNVLSDYTFAVRKSEDDDTLLNIGKAYSGLTDAEISELTTWFKEHTIQTYGRVHLIEPKIVLEVAFDAVQPSPRHKSGYALRFPRIVRIRDDKTPAEIDTLATVAQLAGTEV